MKEGIPPSRHIYWGYLEMLYDERRLITDARLVEGASISASVKSSLRILSRLATYLKAMKVANGRR